MIQNILNFQAQQPLDAHRAFYFLLFSLLASCISRSSNYTVSQLLIFFLKFVNSLVSSGNCNFNYSFFMLIVFVWYWI